MKESYGEGLATHTGPESCGAACEGGIEALTGARAGWVMSRETTFFRDADAVEVSGRLYPLHRYREMQQGPARSETIDDVAVSGKGSEGRLFVFPHEAAIAIDVGAQDSCELTLQYSPLDDGDTCAAFLLFQIALTEVAAASVRKCYIPGSRNVVSGLITGKMIGSVGDDVLVHQR
jgi:hypothetical protein